jgi:Carboxylesterase family
MHKNLTTNITRIYGGGYAYGSKGGLTQGNPSGLIAASQAGGGSGIIFVQLNYRVGAFGFLAGPTLEAAGGVSNAGLYDQRLAIEWVVKYAHLFGGDGKTLHSSASQLVVEVLCTRSQHLVGRRVSPSKARFLRAREDLLRLHYFGVY